MTAAPPIFLLTDFGWRDSYVGQVKAVLAHRTPDSTVIDISHEVSPFAIDEGAWLLETVLPFVPPGAIFVAVVDPGVGGERLPIAIRLPATSAGARYFVGPNNGLLSALAPRCARPSETCVAARPDGIDVRVIESKEARHAVVSDTFHGRDIFAPAAAAIARSGSHELLGRPLQELTLLPPFEGRPADDGCLLGAVIHVDRYGNLVTTIRAEQLPGASLEQSQGSYTLELGGQVVELAVRSFSDAPIGSLASHVDLSGFLAIAVREGSAVERLGAVRGDAVLLRPR